MALRDTSLRLPKLFSRAVAPAFTTSQLQCRSYASDAKTSDIVAKDLQDLETESGFTSGPLPDESVIKQFDPIARSRRRKTQLPASRYVHITTIPPESFFISLKKDVTDSIDRSVITSAPHDTTVAHCTLTDPPQTGTLPRDASSPGPSCSLASNRPTSLQLTLTS